MTLAATRSGNWQINELRPEIAKAAISESLGLLQIVRQRESNPNPELSRFGCVAGQHGPLPARLQRRGGSTAQMRRAAVSVPSNVAEGQACGEDGRYIHHLRIALGSVGELSTQLEIVRRLRMLPESGIGKADEHLTRTGQVLHGLLRSRLKKRRLRVCGSALLTGLALWLFAFPVLG